MTLAHFSVWYNVVPKKESGKNDGCDAAGPGW